MGEREEEGGGSDTLVSSCVFSELAGVDRLDEELLDQAVRELNRLVDKKGLRLALEVGRYVIDAFFEGDYGAFREQGKKYLTFRQLGMREDLLLSYSSIYHYVAVTEQVGRLPDELALELTLSHHKILLPVKDSQAEIDLARAVVEEGLSVSVFQQRVHAWLRGGGRRRGVKQPLPEEVKTLSRLEKTVERIEVDEFKGDEILNHFDAPRIERLANNLDGVSLALHGVLEPPQEGDG